MPFTYAGMQSRMQGAWPGMVGRLGKLPYSWSVVNRGLVVSIVQIGAIGPADTIDLQLYGNARSTNPVIVYMGAPKPIAGGAQNIATTVGIAMVGGSKANINKMMIGIETRDAGNAVLASPSNDVAEWPTLGPSARIVRNTVAIAAGYTSAVLWLGLDVVIGPPIDVTLRLGWIGAETATGTPFMLTTELS